MDIQNAKQDNYVIKTLYLIFYFWIIFNSVFQEISDQQLLLLCTW